MPRSFVCLFVAASLLGVARDGSAYEVVPAQRPGEYLKWGASRQAGTGGGEVTWGFVAAGTPGSEYCGVFCPGGSLGELPNFYPDPRRGNAAQPLTIERLQPVFQAAFDAWSAVADIRFRSASGPTPGSPIRAAPTR